MEDWGLNKALVAKVYSLMHCQGAQGRARRKAKRTGGPLKQLGGVPRREPEGRPEEVGGFCYRTGNQPVLRKPKSRTEGSFSLVSRWVSGQESLPSKSMFLVSFGCFPLVLAQYLAYLACFDGGDVRRQQPMSNCQKTDEAFIRPSRAL